MLLYFVGLVLVATLSPFDFRSYSIHRWHMMVLRDDVALNVLLFVPLGFLSPLAFRARGFSLLSLVLCACALSALVEVGQKFLPSRHPNFVDVFANVFGALLGALVERRLTRVFSRLMANELVLELPITGSLYLLFALCAVFSVGVTGRADLWRALPLAPFAAVSLGALYRERAGRADGRARLRFAGYAALGAFLALLVTFLRLPWFTLGVCLLFALSTWLATDIGGPRVPTQRRFETATGLRALPWLTVYLLLLAVRRPAGAALGNQAALALLELCLAQTLLGYVWSQLLSRAEQKPKVLVALISLAGLPVAVMLELCQGAGTLTERTVRVLCLTLSVTAGAALHRAQVELVRSYRKARAART
jgi:glycopeptide antibiotics resistance protein